MNPWTLIAHVRFSANEMPRAMPLVLGVETWALDFAKTCIVGGAVDILLELREEDPPTSRPWVVTCTYWHWSRGGSS